MKNFSLLFLSLLLFVSCGVKDDPIPVEELWGTYDMNNGRKITFNRDSTYLYRYFEDGVEKSEVGVWYYTCFEPPLSYNYLNAYDMRVVSGNGKRKYATKYATFYFYVCKHWGKVRITKGYMDDPDGAPALIWFKKIE